MTAFRSRFRSQSRSRAGSLQPSATGSLLPSTEDYGIKLPPGDEVYEFMWRGDVDQKGLGIGLHVARRIADAHGAKMKHDCNLVSEFNVPLIESYISQTFDGKNEGLVPVLRAELKRLEAEAQYNNIVARDRFGDVKYRPLRSPQK
jgi:hypothetical protein